MLKYVGPEGGHLKANLTSSGSNVVVTQVSVSLEIFEAKNSLK